jgi:hypothetical protein
MNNSGIKLKEVERPTKFTKLRRVMIKSYQIRASLRTISPELEGNRIIGAEGLIKTFSYYLNYFELNRKTNKLINCSINSLSDLFETFNALLKDLLRFTKGLIQDLLKNIRRFTKDLLNLINYLFKFTKEYNLKGERTLVFYPGNDIQKDLLSVALIACIT